MPEWFEGFFDDLYYETYRVFEDEDRNEREARFIVEALGLRDGARVLDLGCGYARHAVYLAKWGYRVVCFDLSQALLARAVERAERFGVSDRVEFVRGDMRSLDYKESFDGVYLFFTSFGYFDDEDNQAVLGGVSRALRRGGRLLLDLWNPVALMHYAYLFDGERRTWFEAGDYVVLEETTYDVLNARVVAKRVFFRRGSTTPVAERSFSVRFYTYWELRKMLENAGMTVERTMGSYSGSDYRPSSPRLIIVARKI